jgi:hypothetical protein
MPSKHRASSTAAAPEQGRMFAKVCREFCAQPPVRAWLLNRTPLTGVDATSLEQACAYVCTFRELGDVRHAAVEGPPKTPSPTGARSDISDGGSAGGIDCDGRAGSHRRDGRDDEEPDWYSNDAEILVPHAVFGDFILATVRLDVASLLHRNVLAI